MPGMFILAKRTPGPSSWGRIFEKAPQILRRETTRLLSKGPQSILAWVVSREGGKSDPGARGAKAQLSQ